MNIVVTFTAEEAEAICAFYSFGATRGNHSGPDNRGPVPGPLSDHIGPMGDAVGKIWTARWRAGHGGDDSGLVMDEPESESWYG